MKLFDIISTKFEEITYANATDQDSIINYLM
ncbi:MAG: hypothetical protein ACJAW3_001058 [Lentimonas sp.]|jgi:hypothetical protein